MLQLSSSVSSDGDPPRCPRVSVVVPVFGVERFVATAIDSVLAQTFRDLELILVDDGSTDRSDEICASYKDPRIRLVRQPNAGLAAARNAGIRLARGEYIALLDADDEWLPGKLARHVEVLDRIPSAGASFCQSENMDLAGRSLGFRFRDVPGAATEVAGAVWADLTPLGILLNNPMAPSNLVIRRSALDRIARTTTGAAGSRVEWFDEDRALPHEDTECLFRMLWTGIRFVHLKQCLTRYRLLVGSLSARHTKNPASSDLFVERIARTAPTLVEQEGRRIKGYMLAGRARDAIWRGDTKTAARLLVYALRSFPEMLREAPGGIAVTILAGSGLIAVPPRARQAVLRTALSMYRRMQQPRTHSLA